MAKKIKSLDEAPVDVVEAVKRGFIHRGFIPRKYRRQSQLSEDSPSESEKTNQNGEGSQEASKDPEEPEPGEVHE
jgi:hypothetical protein